MLELKKFSNRSDLENVLSINKLVEFLHKHLGQYGDEKDAIEKSIRFAFKEENGLGGFIVLAHYDGKLAGALVMNSTGMKDYIPENILVYVTVDSNFRNLGIGKQIVEKAIEEAKGDVKLHVENENPAKRLYERIGFKNKYAEMRFIKE